MRIVAENLSHVYSPKSKFAVAALHDVSLTVEEGEFFGIIGHTGSGKSTFVQHLNGLIKADKGTKTLRVGEFDLLDKKCDFKKLRSRIGMVFQYPEYQLFADTVELDVAFGLKNFRPECSENEVKSLVRDALETVGLDYAEVKDKSPFDLSGGQKRRVAIAGVIVTKPEILVLDEPVAGLDPKGKREFFDLLHKLHNSFVKTVIIISHDMDNVAENCSRVAVFDGGKIVAVATPKELFCNTQKLLSLGLDVPVTGYLADVLKKNGVFIDTAFTVKDFTEKVLKTWRERG